MTDIETIETVCENLKQTLVKKNKAYGQSAFKSPLLAPNMRSGSAILVRMSDKIERLSALQQGENDNGETFDDTILDLAGYCILYLANRASNNE